MAWSPRTLSLHPFHIQLISSTTTCNTMTSFLESISVSISSAHYSHFCLLAFVHTTSHDPECQQSPFCLLNSMHPLRTISDFYLFQNAFPNYSNLILAIPKILQGCIFLSHLDTYIHDWEPKIIFCPCIIAIS